MDKTARSLIAVFDPLNRDSYRRRCESVVPSIYLTFISIIQGIALGLLAQNLFALVSGNPDRLILFGSRFPYAVSTFLSIIIVTYEYIALTLVHRYSYRLLDTIILFVVGFAQITPSFFLDSPAHWWGANIVFCGAGALAFVNERARNSKAAFAVEGIYEMARAKLRFDIIVSVLAMCWCLMAALILPKAWGWPLLVPMILVQVGILLRERNYISGIHDKLGMEW